MSEEEQPPIAFLHHFSVEKLYPVVMDQQWALRTETFLKKRWNPRKTWRRKHLIRFSALVTLNDAIKWASACKVLSSLLIPMLLRMVKGHNLNRPSREEHKGINFTAKIHFPKGEWEWHETFSLKSVRETEGKEWDLFAKDFSSLLFSYFVWWRILFIKYGMKSRK